MVRTTSGSNSHNVIISYVMYIISFNHIIHLTNIYIYLNIYMVYHEKIVIYTMIMKMITNLRYT